MQQGNSTLGMVLMLMLLGGLTLNATRTQLGQSMVLVADEQQHYQDYWRAQSALQWGISLRWLQAAGWQCQLSAAQGWQSCLLRLEDNNALLSGQGEGRELRLWRWVSLRDGIPQAKAHGWIDYCPLARAELCQPAVEAAGI